MAASASTAQQPPSYGTKGRTISTTKVTDVIRKFEASSSTDLPVLASPIRRKSSTAPPHSFGKSQPGSARHGMGPADQEQGTSPAGASSGASQPTPAATNTEGSSPGQPTPA
eukprot:CAMPEP_0177662078 /NCGR_PEP_ID=MMETSP0447-20121125/19071_1 /TAXON_ID=0 /ORGANISM="Stygamoeba regulata, Strain BSH-02190019" /LENGTH=111 /DNA_ID=CAMNT_0019167565 /DNA_START=280 /DNA_END=611 /DNA_ORIENTATION=-